MSTDTFSLKSIVSRKCLEDYKTTKVGAIDNVKFSRDIGEDEQISIISDAMFKTMLASSNRKMYICKLLSGLLHVPYEQVFDNAEYYKNELDKTSVESKGRGRT